MASVNCNTPPTLNIASGNIAENFRKWKQQVQVFIMAAGLSSASKERRTAVILNFAGEDVLEIYNHFVFATGEDKDDPEVVMKKIEEYCTPKVSEVYEAYKFWTTPLSKPIDHFVSELRTRAKNCNFKDMQDRLIRDKVMFTIDDNALRNRLLRETDNLTLEKVLSTCRAHELAASQISEMCKGGPTPSTSINQTGHAVNKLSKPQGYEDKPSGPAKLCKFCGKKHPWKASLCPAFGKVCLACNKRNHFQGTPVCTARSVRQLSEEGLCPNKSTQEYVAPQETTHWIGTLKSKGKCIFAAMLIQGTQVDFQLDTGAETNTISINFVKQEMIKPSSSNLITWDNKIIKPVGETHLPLTNPIDKQEHIIKFTVVDVENSANLLGLETCERLGLVTINKENFKIASLSTVNLQNLYPNVFDKDSIGKFPGKINLHVKEGAIPKQLPCRNVPLSIMDEVKAELDRLEKSSVLVKVTEPTEWVSQMAVARKKSGDIRICIDPKPLNAVLMRERYKLPTVEDAIAKFGNCDTFSKFDVKNAFWHCELDEESSFLTTMITPFGRYRWSRLPFGVNVASEIFQRKLLEQLDGLEYTIAIADDCSIASPEKEHDKAIHAFLQRCNDSNIRLNSSPDKLQIRTPEMLLHGHVFTKDGVKPNPDKVQAIIDLPRPSDKSGVRSFCGSVQYLSKFIPNLSEEATVLRQLTKKDTPWEWTESHEICFERIKELVANATLLTYYDPNKELTIQSDASDHGLGSVLIQEGKPLAFASKALNQQQQGYAPIEKECLGVITALEHFDQYAFGRPVKVDTDHQPLQTIAPKPLNQMPKRLQYMFMDMGRWDVTIKWKRGSEMVVPDMFSRNHATKKVGTCDSRDYDAINALAYLPVSDNRLKEIQEATEQDPTLHSLRLIIQRGWPNTKAELSEELKPYFDIRDTLQVEDGIILKGERLLIPTSMRKEIKARLHTAHLGKDSMLRRARELIYWPGLTDEITQIAESCEVCMMTSRRQQKEPMIPHVRGNAAWQKVGTDIFTINNRNYLITVDYFSGFWEVDFLTSTYSSTIILKLKAHFSRYGIPQELMSDNAQFESRECTQFYSEWGINKTSSSPGYPQSNGKVESAVKAARTMISKCMKTREDQYLALLELRNTNQTAPIERMEKRVRQ